MKTTASGGVRASVWLLALALVLVGLAVLVVIQPAVQRAQTVSTDAGPSSPAAHTSAQEPALGAKAPPGIAPAVVEVRRVPDKGSDTAAEPPAAAARPAAAPPAAAEQAPADAAGDAPAGQATGIAAFPPQGTKPIVRGIIVPDDVELPPGYVRHYQSTFEGRLLPPILMFHPDYQPVDERGAPIPLPEDRVVPADMAPPGMPVQMLDVPEDGSPMPGVSARGQHQGE